MCAAIGSGTGNEDATEIERIVRIYALAGVKYFDVCASREAVLAAQKGLLLANKVGCINVSMGIAGDPHSDKCSIDNKRCIDCGVQFC